MTEPLFRTDPYRRTAEARVTALTDHGGIVLDSSVFYPQGGGQPGDTGRLEWDGRSVAITGTSKGPEGSIVLHPHETGPHPEVDMLVRQELDWGRRYRHMQIHTALHLLSVVLPHPVTGGAISSEKGRLDFSMSEPIADKDAVTNSLQALVDRDLVVSEEWIDEAELDANPGLVKTMSVQPPRGQGRIRLVAIGDGLERVDLQPCGGTHVLRTGEIGRIRLGKVEKKGAQNRRVSIVLD